MIALMKALMWLCNKTGRVFMITGTAGPEDVYLIRYYIVRSKYMNIFIHQFLRSDRDDLHDHPWNFATYLVKGAYTEQRRQFDSIGDYQDVPTRRINDGKTKLNTFVRRKATDLHRVVVDRDLKLAERNEAALTLFVSGPFKRDWGFVKNDQWIDWRVYLGLPPNTPGRG
jgi:hypothetical protein